MNKKPTVRQVEALKVDGFPLQEDGNDIADVAVLSLRLGLHAYFSSYAAVRPYWRLLHDPQAGSPGGDPDKQYAVSYCESAAEAIVHLQHFFELVFKGYLRSRHRLLATDAGRKTLILDDLARNIPVSDEALEGTRSPEFSETLERLFDLIKAGRLPSDLNFLADTRATFDVLGYLRNRLWHRGLFILRYPALGELVGRYLLPPLLTIVGRLGLIRSGRQLVYRV
jgi:hypothetical protein